MSEARDKPRHGWERFAVADALSAIAKRVWASKHGIGTRKQATYSLLANLDRKVTTDGFGWNPFDLDAFLIELRGGIEKLREMDEDGFDLEAAVEELRASLRRIKERLKGETR